MIGTMLVLWILYFWILFSTTFADGIHYSIGKDVPEAPFNLTIEALDSKTLALTWKIHDRYIHTIQNFELTTHSIPDGELAHLQLGETTTQMLDGLERSADVTGLIPSSQYQVHLVAIGTNNRRSNASESITFRTLPDKGEAQKKLLVHPGEVTIVALILIAWVCAIAVFLQKWGRIRIVHNQEPRFKREFKNLDTIKVVKRPTDSVIYRSYPRQVTKTMAAREKRIERMNTMPNIKIPEAIPESNKKNSEPISEVDNHKKMVQRFKTLATLPVIEMEEESDSDGGHEFRPAARRNQHRKEVQKPVIELDELQSTENHSES